ncbi:LpqB family beta-propeller domain-containing protein [Streptomyces sp. TRM 70361]|uniref:LpqB family beta-propeller domain-containing protein n=1 Tax=Streptomyces sp. TRM 70361 TaxID=3116553 RepID=UPI002E7BD902|nr:LpqB family beta-propeller domain-containing protein [Streptomyces sp. TRM 70361]MEE1937827.1 LpqB family beta-propeller domain-containing protein [Streptomyces sp. TRM 70361]
MATGTVTERIRTADGRARPDRPALRALRRTGAAAGAAALLLAGCASMPDEGEVRRVNPSLRADTDSQVRVFGVSPRKDAPPAQIVRGFLEATTSEEPDFSTAREYLTGRTAKSWDPFARTTVLDGAPGVLSPGGAVTGGASTGHTMEVTGSTVAVVDGEHAYRPAEGTYRETFQLVRVDGQWRIDRLPDGLVVAESDFQRIYQPVNIYHYADLGPDTGAVTRGRDVLVADPVYVRRRIDPVTETVRTLLDGPTGWLAPVVDSAFPADVRLPDGARLSPDDSGTLTVPLTRGRADERERPIRVDRAQCERMAAQLLHTVDGQLASKIGRVRLTLGEGGEELCSQTGEEAREYAPGRLNGDLDHRQYFIDSADRLAMVVGGAGSTAPVPGPFSAGQAGMRAVSVSRDEARGAGISLDGRSLYVAPLETGVALGESVLTSEAEREGDRLTAPSWDGLGDLWVADRNPADPRLLRLRGGQEEPEEVEVTGLGDGRIEDLRISSDGVRIALLISVDGRTTLQLGRVERQDVGGGLSGAAVTGLRPVAPRMEDVVDASWAGDSRLVVVGRESAGVQQLRYTATDGSPVSPATLPGLNEVTGVAASENDEEPLLADTREGIARLARDGEWELVTEEGSTPAYPG